MLWSAINFSLNVLASRDEDGLMNDDSRADDGASTRDELGVDGGIDDSERIGGTASACGGTEFLIQKNPNRSAPIAGKITCKRRLIS